MSDRSGLRLRITRDRADLRRALQLRSRLFRKSDDWRRDADQFDTGADHVLIESSATGAVLATVRVTRISGVEELARSYVGQFYDLGAIADRHGCFLELGRFCAVPDLHPDGLRLVFAALTRMTAEQGAGALVGCTSLPGTDPDVWADCLSMLAADFRLDCAIPVISARRFAVSQRAYDRKRALLQLPPLLRTYLGMGARVADEGAIDPDLGTCHLFTMLETGSVPVSRARLLHIAAARAIALD